VVVCAVIYSHKTICSSVIPVPFAFWEEIAALGLVLLGLRNGDGVADLILLPKWALIGIRTAAIRGDI